MDKRETYPWHLDNNKKSEPFMVPFTDHALAWKFATGKALAYNVMEWIAARVMLPGSAVQWLNTGLLVDTDGP